MSECRRPECSLRHSANTAKTVSKGISACLKLHCPHKGKAAEAVKSVNNIKDRKSKNSRYNRNSRKIEISKKTECPPESDDSGGHRGGERRPAGPALSCYARILTSAWNKAAYENPAEKRKEDAGQGSGRAIEEDGKAEMPVPPAAREVESAGQAL